MKSYPSDIEQLMWAVAERGDREAIEDFETRFPSLRYELGKRIATVRALRDSKSLGAHDGSIPSFQRPYVSQSSGRRLGWTLGTFALGALAVASYFVADQMMRPDVPPRSGASVGRPQPEPFVERYDAPRTAPLPTPSTPPGSSTVDTPLPRYALTHSVRVENSPLEDAIREIARVTGLAIEIGPGLPNDRIRLRYTALTGMQMLTDLGSRFGFTAFDQGDGKVLIIPAIDPSVATSKDAVPISPNVDDVRSMPAPETQPSVDPSGRTGG